MTSGQVLILEEVVRLQTDPVGLLHLGYLTHGEFAHERQVVDGDIQLG